jgi:hypothetical protein
MSLHLLVIEALSDCDNSHLCTVERFIENPIRPPFCFGVTIGSLFYCLVARNCRESMVTLTLNSKVGGDFFTNSYTGKSYTIIKQVLYVHLLGFQILFVDFNFTLFCFDQFFYYLKTNRRVHVRVFS